MKTPIRIARGVSAALPQAEPNPSHQIVAQYRGPNVGVEAFLTFPPGSIQTKNTFQFGDIAFHASAKIP